MSEPLEPTRRQRRGTSRRGLIAAVVLAAVAGGIGTKAVSQGFGPGGWHGPGWGGPGMMGGGGFDPARAEQHAERMVKHLAIEIDATKEQQDKMIAIARALVKEMAPMRETMLANRQKARDLFTAAQIDRAAIEKLRAEQMGNADAFTRRLVQSLADMADVLTPEQRRTIADRFPPFGGFPPGPRRG